MVEDVVIGSGPTAWAAVEGILSRGGRPIVIDFGSNPNLPSPSIKGTSALALKGDDAKARLFSYPESMVVSEDGGQLPLSSARGGLSRIWGSGILVRDGNELGLPHQIVSELTVSSRMLLDLMPSTGGNDEISQRFELPRTDGIAHHSNRVERIIREAKVDVSDVLIGSPRLSVNIVSDSCTRCGMCLQGCPASLFFSSDEKLGQLAAEDKIQFVQGPVEKISLNGGLVEVVLPIGNLIARRVFLAAGPIATPALLQKSGLAASRIRVQDSAVFYSVALNLGQAVGHEGEFTAAQMSLYSARAGDEDFQLSVYESSSDYSQRLRSALPKFLSRVQIPKKLIDRLNPVIGFVNSSESGYLELIFDGSATRVSRTSNRASRPAAIKAMRRARNKLQPTDLHFLPQAVVIPKVGSGYHSGSGIPMGGEGLTFESSLRAAPQVFVVDASALPFIPAGSHTFLAMSNAYRVAGKQP